MTNSQVAHLYAQRTHTTGKAPNLFFERDIIYSYGYHFPIAKFKDHPKTGETVLLFTLRSYSNTTAKHISEVRRATTQYKKIYMYDLTGPKWHFEKTEQIIKESLNSLKTARKPHIHIKRIKKVVRQAKAVLVMFPKFKLYKKDFKNTYIAIKKSVSVLVGAENMKVAVKSFKRDIDKRRQKEVIQRLSNDKKIQLWRKGKNVNFYSKNTFLRYNRKSNKVETSKQIKLSIDECKKVFNAWLNSPSSLIGRKVQNTYIVNSCSQSILVVGCHTITAKERDHLAKLLKW